ncbi:MULTISPECIES: DUF547 domain-containing protein [unclassified Sphingomonas]|uniref:DUF547 domain-containing protein n=1 Tax=unclassified Sphingomonas TaxID=196159 RepID=UPI000BCF7139|nr:MAG: DUF547 domain-containing protein [Sphingomonas sp. 12-62-6]OYX40622.1 MAG: DUF547 domain-containing protein [Sphingomonas sp. 32-62-10]
MKLVLALLMLFAPLAAKAQTFDHGQWDALLKRHVVMVRGGAASQVRYDGMARDRAALTAYLASTGKVSRATFDGWAKPEQLAFLINVYNAATVELILTGYPKVKSIRELGTLFQGPWAKPFVTLLGKTVSLDDIEHGLIRGSGRYNDPRIHFAVNCASIGCPALSRAAFRGTTLDPQLDAAARGFLSDRTRNRVQGSGVAVSMIFKWYRGDFEKGWRGAKTLPAFFALYADSIGLSPAAAEGARSGKLTISYLDYDWQLNKAA